MSWWPDPRGANHGKLHMGTVIEHIGDLVSVVWDEDDEHYEEWNASDMRYRIDRGQMRLQRPPKKPRLRIPESELLCKVCGKPRQLKCGHRNPGAPKPEEWGRVGDFPRLTSGEGFDMISSSNEGDALTMNQRGHNTMATKKKAPVIEPEEELEELEELETPEEKAPRVDGDTDGQLSAKQVASLLGTDARTLRKFLRSKHGTIGQGQRWLFKEDDIDALKAEFNGRATKSNGEAKLKAKGEKAPAASKTTKKAPAELPEADDEDTLDEADLEALDEIEDDEELEEVED